jgi:hypothetical protein
MSDLLVREDYLAALQRDFPDVAADIDPDIEGGLLHLEIATLCRHAQAAIDAGDRASVRKHFAFADDLFRRSGPELKNAIYVSYLEHLHFGGHRQYAEALLPSALHAGWVEINQYLDSLRPGGDLDGKRHP